MLASGAFRTVTGMNLNHKKCCWVNGKQIGDAHREWMAATCPDYRERSGQICQNFFDAVDPKDIRTSGPLHRKA